MKIGTASQFRFYDSLIMSQYNQSIEQMILKAAKSLYPYVSKETSVVIIAGKGNNGGDGLALACILKNMNVDVTVFVTSEKSKMNPGATFYLEKCIELNVSTFVLTKENDYSYIMLLDRLKKATVIVDAIFGTGLNSHPRDVEAKVIQLLNTQATCPIVAIDVPSGLNCDTGEAYTPCIHAHLTISFVAMKLSFYNPEAKPYLGEVVVEDLGYPQEALALSMFSEIVDGKVVEKLLKQRLYAGYKSTYGMVGCVVGSEMYPGAALISTKAALKTGAGYVKLISEDPFVRQSCILNAPEMVLSQDTSLTGCQAILLGCGLGQSELSKQKLHRVLQDCHVPLVLDADGINLLALQPELLKTTHAKLILTPHLGEMKRLCDSLSIADPIIGAGIIAKTYHCVVVLKGPKTLVIDENHALRIPTGNKAMATAGMGDCLAGMIASLLAQGYSCYEASLLGAYLHGKIGDQLALNQYTVHASDIIDQIPNVMHQILKY